MNEIDFCGFRSKFQNYIDEVERSTQLFKQQLAEERKEIESCPKRVANLSNSFFLKESNGNSESPEPMKISLPTKTLFDTIFKEDTQNDAFFFSEDRDEKKRRLAAERRAEYNAFLARRDHEQFAKRKVHEEMSTNITPKSILESVDYESLLAKRKEEEMKFRSLNHAEPSLNGSISSHDAPSSRQTFELPEKNYPSELNNIKNTRYSNTEPDSSKVRSIVTPHSTSESQTFREISNRPLSSQERHIRRTGGGGEPVRDSSGNLITVRGFRETAPILLLPSFKQDFSSNKKSSYREELARQIEEKKRLAGLEKEKAQEIENRLAQRIEEQRRKMQMEYENELKVNNNVKEQRQQERLRQLEEYQRKEEELKRKSKESRIVQRETPVSENLTESIPVNTRSSSPPVPSVRSKVIFEKAVSPQTLSDVTIKPENVFSSLAEIMRRIKQDNPNPDRRMKESYEVMNRRTVPDVLEDEEDYDIRGISEQQETLRA